MLTFAVLVRLLQPATVPTTVTVATPPLPAIVPRLQLSGLVLAQLPCEGVALVAVKPAGKVSVTVAFGASPAPALVAVIV